MYDEVLHAVVNQCEGMRRSVDPTTVIGDFEQAAMSSMAAVLGQYVVVRGCFFHLCQSTWRRIQEFGLSSTYKENGNVRHFCEMVDGLEFPPLTELSNLRHVM